MLLEISEARKGLLTELTLVRAALKLRLLFPLLLELPVDVDFISLHLRSAVVRRWEADGCVRRVELWKRDLLQFFPHFAFAQGFRSTKAHKLAASASGKRGKSIFAALQTQMIINHRSNGNLYYT